MFLTNQFQEFMQKEKELYTGISNHLNETLGNSIDFTYQSVFQLFCHLSILHNTQAQVMQALMKMIGSLVDQNKKDPQIVHPKIDVTINPTKFTPPNYFDIFEDKQSQEPQLIEPKQEKQSILTEIEHPNSKAFRETVRNKKEREQMQAHFCADCESFYNALPKNSKIEKMKHDHSRHRANFQINQQKLLLTPE